MNPRQRCKPFRSVGPIACGLASLLWASAALAVPAQVPYFGYLTYANGVPYQGTVTVQATLYPDATEPTPHWGPDAIGSVDVVDGHLSFVLGDGALPLELADVDLTQLWLEVQINGTPLLPRQRFLSVPYARLAEDSTSLGGLPAASYVESADLPAVAVSGSYGDLVGAPALSPVATSGDYADLTNKPDLSGLVSPWTDASGGGITTPGPVGIGVDPPAAALDVAGAIKVGSASVCDATTAGSLRYQAGRLELCDGALWQPHAFQGEGGSGGTFVLQGGGSTLLHAMSFESPNEAGSELALPTGVSASDRILAFPFNGSSANYGSLTDAVTDYGPVVYTAGKAGESVNQLGAGRYVRVPRASSIYFSAHTATGYTATAWVRGTDTSAALGSYRVANNIFGDDTNGYWMGAGVSQGRASVRSAAVETIGNIVVSDGNWHHLAFVFTYAGGAWSAQAYVDGAPDGSATLPTDGNSNYGFNAIGTTYTPVAQIYGYAIDNAHVYARALSAAQIGELVANTDPAPPRDAGSIGEDTSIVGSPTTVAGYSGQALSGFSASTYVRIPRLVIDDYRATGFSASAWVKGTDTTARQGDYRVANNIFGDTTTSYWMGMGVSQGRASVCSGSTETLGDIFVADNQWHHLAYVWRFSGGAWRVRVYVDGVRNGYGSLPTGGNPYFAIDAIGTTRTNIGQSYGYAIDEVALFGTALTDDAVATLAGQQ